MMSSTSVESPPCKAKSNGVVASSLGSSKALTPPGRHKRKWNSLGRAHLTAKCRRDSLCRDTEEKEKKNGLLIPPVIKFVLCIFPKEMMYWV